MKALHVLLALSLGLSVNAQSPRQVQRVAQLNGVFETFQVGAKNPPPKRAADKSRIMVSTGRGLLTITHYGFGSYLTIIGRKENAAYVQRIHVPLSELSKATITATSHGLSIKTESNVIALDLRLLSDTTYRYEKVSLVEIFLCTPHIKDDALRTKLCQSFASQVQAIAQGK